MKAIRIIRPVGNWVVGYERNEPDDECAKRLVTEGIAEYITTEPKVMDKQFHTLEQVMEQERAITAQADREALSASSTSTATAVRKKG